MTTLRILLGDQLNPFHSWFKTLDTSVVYAFFENRQEATYAPHHIQKIVGVFGAMRQFAHWLKCEGHQVSYTRIHENSEFSIVNNIKDLASELGASKIEIMEPDEWRLQSDFLNLMEECLLPITFVSSEHFISTQDEFENLFSGKKSFLMETFYRSLRKRTGILMNADRPEGDQWNLDGENRKKLPKNHLIPPPFFVTTDTTEVVEDLKAAGIKGIGSLGDPKHFYWPTTPEQGKSLFEHWLEYGLPYFGDYQDAMSTQSWAMYHSRISFALNLKMLDPLWVCRRVEQAYREREEVKLNAAEGFIRQILGWREFMRGAYWMRMPDFANENFFRHKNKLPSWFWDGKTKMNCQRQAIGQSLEHSYAHHIQRLMVTGNFALLAGIDPDEVDQWYLGIYIDAFEWVEMPNTRGMSQFADGGWIASKPYVASANYMKKMGDYCDGCRYNPKSKTDEDSCPLNALYWDFFDRNRDKLANNHRLGMVYRTYDKMHLETKEAIRYKAHTILENLDRL
jgi:deoxyribodipyrimidine photolyase-related protein